MSMRKVDHPYAEGTEARYRHDLLNRDAVIAHLQERADRAELAVGTLQAALRQQIEQWRARIDAERERLAECYKLPYNLPRANVRSARLDATTECADELERLLPALEPTP